MTNPVWKFFGVLVLVLLLAACSSQNLGSTPEEQPQPEPDSSSAREEENDTPEPEKTESTTSNSDGDQADGTESSGAEDNDSNANEEESGSSDSTDVESDVETDDTTEPAETEESDTDSSTTNEESSQSDSGETDSSESTNENAQEPQTFDLPKGPTASPGASLSSDLTTTNVDYTMHEFLEYILSDVDEYWSNIMVSNGYPMPYVNYVFPTKDEQLYDTCGSEEEKKAVYTNNNAAFYCTLDDTIVVSQDLAQRIWVGDYRTNDEVFVTDDAGDFSVAIVVAHEFAHSLQQEIGWFSEAGAGTTSRSIELNADCLTGVWANSVYARGMLEAGDIEEAIRTLSDIGTDAENTTKTHGLPAERTEAFNIGYNEGSAASCDHYLTNKY